jgi:hypothetical protein
LDRETETYSETKILLLGTILASGGVKEKAEVIFDIYDPFVSGALTLDLFLEVIEGLFETIVQVLPFVAVGEASGPV